jgi:putative phosphoesterase
MPILMLVAVRSVAVITDVHGNLAAVEAVLAALEDRGVDQTLCGGDLVGYGAHPNGVCELMEHRGIPTVYGNYDHAIGRDHEDCGCAYRDRRDRELGERSIAWTLEHTGRPAKEFLRGLPFDLRFDLAGRRVRLVHGSPRKVNEYLFEDKPARTFERIAAGADCDVLVFGHTHQPWVHEYGGVLFVNCGSVGKPKDGDPRASFALLEEGETGVSASIERLAYDAEKAARDVTAAGLPSEYGDQLLAGA